MESRALGKGLSALIPNNPEAVRGEGVRFLKTTAIKDSALQPRTNYDAQKLAQLVESIKEKGVLQPILVREKEDGYEVVAGERRLRAARQLNIVEVPAIIKKVSDQEALVLALVENIQREELNPLEEAQAFKKLIESFGFTQDAVAQSVGRDRSTISNQLRLLKLPEEIQKSLFEGHLSEGHARALLAVESFLHQKEIFEYAVSNKISVRELEKIIREGLQSGSRREKAKSANRDQNVVALEENLQQVLGTKVRINAKKKSGKIIIEYYSNGDLDRIIQRLIK
ncbi:MAG: hypothetical protein A2787_06000 [Omnitrophica WOR_2 bacterium RIFCSPHIGHO2_01_FULL_48_9]|nr:MAG: hypothetical protein A3D10_04865 [Omnitrophica WOR_2 bacterium RIFCSPHIGHO2_02_FULL_48_11]OGX30946.1 MAG: hypothetical protein A2787_06000 [Omnitrophica WOR_2 bacterium RIFCSPHIGHO2_01_FULL_48_9]